MTTPISSNRPQPKIIVDEDFEEIKDIMKGTVGEVLTKTSEKTKKVLKQQADQAIENIITPLTTISKEGATQPSPKEFSPIVHEFIDLTVKPTTRRIIHYSIDKTVDSSAKKVIDQSIDTSIHSTTSMINGIYTYIRSKFM